MSSKLAQTKNPGRNNIRRLLDSFEITGPHGRHVVLVMQAAQMSLRDFKTVFKPDGFDESFVKGAVQELLKALDFIHSEAELVHTGPMLLSDFGEARPGPGPHAGDIMPIQYRAPETIMYIAWSYPVDIWSVGLTAWDLLGSKRLFTAKDEDGQVYDAAHLAEMIATLGPPPPEFLKRNPETTAEFWDDQGNWLDLAPIPNNRSLEELETKLEDSSGFIAFLRRVLTWTPEDRPTARELLQDPWVSGKKGDE
ncbi:hypothetical protein F66182_3088 [Fusarium sp. NRRL 66182]|nr:hypothetical protein F66182_3088 [Fusarium sp. NRRL 66182]